MTDTRTPSPSPSPSMQGKTVLLTGATQGIGRAAAREIARHGPTLVLVSRDPDRGRRTVEEVKSESGNARVELLVADLSRQSGVRGLAHDFLAAHDRLHVLVNNAGAIFASRELTADGVEHTFALNHLAYFLLTKELLPVLQSSAPARIVNVASAAHFRGKVDFDDLQGERGYFSFRAYSQSKLCNVLFTYELARRLEGTRVTANCLHPGFVRSGFGRNRPGLLNAAVAITTAVAAITPEKGAQTLIHLATAGDVEGVTGKYFFQNRARHSSRASQNEATAKRLWELSEKLVGSPGPT
jgi:NAD(P)-dependent dehydrogenase (short-subunit alcohol dehydrogenase family)